MTYAVLSDLNEKKIDSSNFKLDTLRTNPFLKTLKNKNLYGKKRGFTAFGTFYESFSPLNFFVIPRAVSYKQISFCKDPLFIKFLGTV